MFNRILIYNFNKILKLKKLNLKKQIKQYSTYTIFFQEIFHAQMKPWPQKNVCHEQLFHQFRKGGHPLAHPHWLVSESVNLCCFVLCSKKSQYERFEVGVGQKMSLKF